MADFKWNPKKSAAAIALAEGKTREQVATELGIGERTIYNWLSAIEFSAEVDRLSLMTGIAGRAERLRIAKRAISQKALENGRVDTDKDLLDWLKFAQSETDGIKLDIAKLAAAIGDDEAPVAGS